MRRTDPRRAGPLLELRNVSALNDRAQYLDSERLKEGKGIPYLGIVVLETSVPSQGGKSHGRHCAAGALDAKERLETGLRQCAEARKRIRYLIILNLLNGRGPTETARVLGVGRSTVYEVARRFREQGEAGLVDHREENGERSWMSGIWLCSTKS